MLVFDTNRFVLDITPGALPPMLKVKQYDGDGTRQYTAVMRKGGTAFNIPSETYQVVVQGTKPDGTGFSYDCVYDGSLVAFNLMTQMTTVFGEVICEIILYDSEGNRIASANFIFLVHRAALQQGTIESHDDFRTLISYVNETREYKDEANDYWKLSKSYAVGDSGVREGENTDNAKYYHDDIQAERLQIDLNKTNIQSIQAQVDQYLDPPAENVGEVVNGRVSYNGTVYPSIGDAIRAQATKMGYISADETIYFSNDGTEVTNG